MSRHDPYDDAYSDWSNDSPYTFTPFDHMYFWAGVLVIILWVIALGIGAGYLWAKHGPAIGHAVRTTFKWLAGAL